MLKRLRATIGDEGGASLVEYALILALLAMAILAGVQSAGSVIQSGFNTIAGAVAGA